jgi:hypothetical protein
MSIDFTIVFVAHANHDIMELTIPQNIEAITAGTRQRFDVVLSIDGYEDCDLDRVLRGARSWGVDEVRLRSRRRNCASGDGANNGHFHHIVERTPYLLTIEEDVVLFRTDPSFDLLTAFRELFERHPQLCVATRMDDSDVWVWQLEDAAPAIEPGVRSVNRVASHFLVYDIARARNHLRSTGQFRLDVFHDTPDDWMNFEDLISYSFAAPSGPGIAFVDDFPIRVYHCDRKIAPGSPHYSKDPAVKVAEFHRRRALMDELSATLTAP